MEPRVVFLLILSTVASDYVCSQNIHASKNPTPVGSNVTLYSKTNFTDGAWLVNNSIIMLITPTAVSVFGSFRGRATFNRNISSVTINSLRAEDSGKYKLQFLDDSEITAELTLSVQVVVRNVTLEAKATALVEFNDTAVLMCSVYSGSSPSYIWMKGNEMLTAGEGVEFSNGDTTVNIVNVTRYDKGPFKCNVSNGVSYEISPPIYLNISYGPSNTTMMIMPMASHYIYRRESNITLSCSAMSSPPAMIQWMFNDTYLTEYGSYLHLVNVTESKSGTYKCVFHNTVTSRFTSASTMLWILDPLEAVEVKATGPAIDDEPLTLRCEVSGTVSRIQWWKDEEIISPNERIVMDNKTLTINPVHTSDKGYYQCQAFNAVSNMTSSRYHVKINYGPETPNITGPTAGKTGYNVTFSCYASSHPPSLYTWYFNHYPVAHTSEYVTPPLTKNMSGMYICEAYNNVTSKNKTAYTMLWVVDPIEDVRVEAPMKYPKEGHKYILECNVTGPADQIYWMKNGLKLHEDNTTTFNINKSLTFDPLKRNDTGYYSCKAMNAVGSMVSDHYKLLVNFGPEAVVIDGPKYAETGRSATFMCSAMSVPESHFRWWYDGTFVADASVFTTDLLTLNMSGEYTCMASNNVTGKNRISFKMLTVIEAIESLIIKNYTVPINLESFSLTCDVIGPYDMIYWMKDDLLLNTSCPDETHQRTNYHIQNNSLLFTPLAIHNNGIYQCDAINKVGGHKSPKYMLQVMYGPLSVTITGPDSGIPGDNVSFKCTANSQPDPDFSWLFNDNSIIKSGSVITFPATKENEGNYTCVAMNPVTRITIRKSKLFTLTGHASAILFPPGGSLLLISVLALLVPMMSN